jgi:hypothetical protein
MPSEQSNNGLTTFSMHAFDESSSGTIEELQNEHTTMQGFSPKVPNVRTSTRRPRRAGSWTRH